MKRITAITKCNGVLSEVLDRKAKRIKRAIEQMADCADDTAAELEEKAEDIINSLGKVADAGNSDVLASKLNEYNRAVEDAKLARNSAVNFRNLLVKLDEEVSETEQ